MSRGTAGALVHTPTRPFGRLVEATDGATLTDIPVDTLSTWVTESRVVVLRGFPTLAKNEFAEYSRGWGEVLEWEVGEVVDLVVEEDPKNYLFASGDVPFHWDGAFVTDNPRWFFFQCLEAAPGAGGETVFCDTTAVYRDADSATRAVWSNISMTYRTEKLAHYGGEVTERLVDHHPATGVPILRFAEPLDPDIYKNPVSVTVDGMPESESKQFLDDLARVVHRAEYCYHHEWRRGDILLADNFALIHGRNAFTGATTRHLQRVEVI